MKIGEFAKKNNLSTKMLRHYDEIGLFRPVAFDADNGYRIYTDAQINELTWILTLKDLGFSLNEIKAIISGPVDAAKLLQSLVQKRSDIQDVILDQFYKSHKIDQLLAYIEKEGFTMEKTVDFSTWQPQDILTTKKAMFTTDHLLEQVDRFFTAIQEGTDFGFIRIDLRQFKAINDQDGYDVGDKIIVSLYKTLEKVTEAYAFNHTIARAGGDEFIVYAEGKNDALIALATEIKNQVNHIDYKALGAHKPIDIYMGIACETYHKGLVVRKVLDDTLVAIQQAHKDIETGKPGIVSLDK